MTVEPLPESQFRQMRDVAREIFGAPDGILAWGAIAHAVQVVPGGFRITARWDFASGSRQAKWLCRNNSCAIRCSLLLA